ncbi:hypothetical protein [Bartonella sp. F02]|uniref:hypothetical protein n=1 Tax=Bartonella sp. F02 TaxID=2967262 RepID=UPI0022A8D3D8|nr:hypothetical protein [Bartonella sp. F02]MCZ2328152.1 hypothetical protein [Bartonella sp. F02]
MCKIHLLLSTLICFIFLVSNVQANTITDEEFKVLEKETFAYSKALQEADANAILKAIPPQIIDALAEKKNLSKLQFQKIIKNQIEQIAKNYKKIEDIKIDQTQKRAGKFDNGIPYFLIPLEFTIRTNDEKKHSIKTEIIALFENHHWYFIRNNNETTLHLINEAFLKSKKVEATSSHMILMHK